jgi:hypothetical protein
MALLAHTEIFHMTFSFGKIRHMNIKRKRGFLPYRVIFGSVISLYKENSEYIVRRSCPHIPSAKLLNFLRKFVLQPMPGSTGRNEFSLQQFPSNTSTLHAAQIFVTLFIPKRKLRGLSPRANYTDCARQS